MTLPHYFPLGPDSANNEGIVLALNDLSDRIATLELESAPAGCSHNYVQTFVDMPDGRHWGHRCLDCNRFVRTQR